MAISNTLKAIADPVRRRILEMLKNGDHSAGEIAAQFELTQATVSYHLKLLREAGLITVRKEQNYIYYGLNTSVFEEVLSWIYDLGGEHDEHE